MRQQISLQFEIQVDKSSLCGRPHQTYKGFGIFAYIQTLLDLSARSMVPIVLPVICYPFQNRYIGEIPHHWEQKYPIHSTHQILF